jgi:hypothetical protein
MRTRSAFAPIELPMVLCVFFLSGLLIAFVFSRFSGPAPWHAWLICGLILPVGLLVLAGVSMLVDFLQSSKGSAIKEQPRAPGPTAKTAKGEKKGDIRTRPVFLWGLLFGM